MLKKLEDANYDKYLEVCKIMGWEPKGDKSQVQSKKAGKFCPECGEPYSPTDKFCPNCGKKLGEVKNTCPECKKVNDSSAKFCSGCGHKLK